MSLPRDLLVAVSVLTSNDQARLRDFARYDPLLIDASRLDHAIEVAVDDRIAFSRGFFAFGGVLLKMSAVSDDMPARNALASVNGRPASSVLMALCSAP